MNGSNGPTNGHARALLEKTTTPGIQPARAVRVASIAVICMVLGCALLMLLALAVALWRWALA